MANDTTRPDKHARVVLAPCESEASVHYCTMYSSLHWTSYALQGTRNTRLCITGHPSRAPWRQTHF